MNEQIVKLQAQFEAELAAVNDAAELENIRVAYLGKKGSITDLLKGMKDLSVEEKKDFGQKVNILKNEATEKISAKMVELKEKEIEREINSMPEFDLSMPADLSRGSATGGF